MLRVILVGAFGIAARRTLDHLLRRRTAPAYVALTYRRLLSACGVRIRVTGVRPTFAESGEPVLVVANHVSWLDVMALAAVQPVTMVSKREIGDWPLIGAVARAAGTVFLDRHNVRQVELTRREIGRRLRAGQIVATFPEATTACGRGLAPMFPAMFQAAIDAAVPVQPVALSWRDSHGELTTAAAYVGDQPLLESVLNVLSQRDLTLQIDILPRIMPKHVRPIDDRKALRTAAAAQIANALHPAVGDWDAHLRPRTCVAARLPEPAAVPDPIGQLAALPTLVTADSQDAEPRRRGRRRHRLIVGSQDEGRP